MQFLSDKEISGKLCELRDFTFTSALPVGRDRTKYSSCMKKFLVLADIFQDSIRACDTLRHLARSLPTLLLSHGFKMIQTRCNRLLKGDLEWLWASSTKLGFVYFCQNARMAFLGRNTPTPHLSEFMAHVDDTIVEAVCRHGTGGGHVDWSPHLRKFANMKALSEYS